MGYLKRAVILAVIVFAMGFAPKAQAAETFLGDFCWNVTYPSDPGFTDVVKLGVFEKDNGHFALYGTVTFLDEFDGVEGVGAVNGNAEVSGSEILVTATGADVETGSPSFAFGTIMQATLDPGTLNGTVHVLEIEQNLTTEALQMFGDTGTMTLTTCP